MSQYTGSTPDTLEPADTWRNDANCRNEDPELFFPKGYEGPWQLVIEQAKTICRHCPAVDACLRFALDNNIGHGIYGGLTDTERASLKRSTTRRHLAPADVTKRAEQARQATDKPHTLTTIFNERTVHTSDGHLTWTGTQQINFRGRKYTGHQVAFIADRGHYPAGRVTTDCGTPGCVLPQHLTDEEERGRCGTRSGYQRHVRNGEAIDDACRAANTDADRRLRTTGTTKVAV